MSGKGHAPRPFDVPREVYESNHARIFGAKPVKERYTPPPLPDPREVKQPIAAAASAARCACVYATSANTESVRKGYEMGGYLKEECSACKSAARLCRAQRTSNTSLEE